MVSFTFYLKEFCIYFYFSSRVNWEQEVAVNATLSDTADRTKLIINYGLILLLALGVFLARTLGFFSMCLKIAYNVHDTLFDRISRAPMNFFNTNSSGNILNSFARDVYVVDCCLPETYLDVLTVSFSFLCSGFSGICEKFSTSIDP